MKVLIAVPCFDMMYSDFAFSLARLLLHQKGAAEVLDIRGSEIAWSRNRAARVAIDGGFTHLLFLDSDMCLPANTLDRLLAHGKPVVGASYVRRQEPYDLLGAPLTSWGDADLVEVRELPTGCLLINVAVLKKMDWPWFQFQYADEEQTGRLSEDIYFCRKVREGGGHIWCDTKLTREIAHVGTKRYTVRDGIEWIQRNAARPA